MSKEIKEITIRIHMEALRWAIFSALMFPFLIFLAFSGDIASINSDTWIVLGLLPFVLMPLYYFIFRVII